LKEYIVKIRLMKEVVMWHEIQTVLIHMGDGLIHLWPYLVITIPLAALVNVVGVSKYINRAFQARPFVAIALAALVGAFSPFCSCGVIPVIASLLIGGVPLAPVMTFWVASPSMDPEIFFLSAGLLGWELAVWRLSVTLVMSLGAGFITHMFVSRGWISSSDLVFSASRTKAVQPGLTSRLWKRAKSSVVYARRRAAGAGGPNQNPVIVAATGRSAAYRAASQSNQCGCGVTTAEPGGSEPGLVDAKETIDEDVHGVFVPTGRKLLGAMAGATIMVAKFMALALFIEALISLYVPSSWVTGLMGQQNAWAIPVVALLGIPAYTSNLTAVPMIAGLLDQGMAPAAALAFLVAGPTTTLPAMAAVWGLVSRRVFALYLGLVLSSAVIFAYVYLIVAQ
jgi:uncharacterized membrane protein YraQ (UPF0718 family)